MLKGNSGGCSCLESGTPSPWTEHTQNSLNMDVPRWTGMRLVLQTLLCEQLEFPGLSVPQSQEGGTICLLLSVPVELQAKRLGGSPGTELLHVLPKWPINYLFACFEYLQLQQKEPCVKLMTLNYFIGPHCLVLLIISTF